MDSPLSILVEVLPTGVIVLLCGLACVVATGLLVVRFLLKATPPGVSLLVAPVCPLLVGAVASFVEIGRATSIIGTQPPELTFALWYGATALALAPMVWCANLAFGLCAWTLAAAAIAVVVKRVRTSSSTGWRQRPGVLTLSWGGAIAVGLVASMLLYGWRESPIGTLAQLTILWMGALGLIIGSEVDRPSALITLLPAGFACLTISEHWERKMAEYTGVATTPPELTVATSSDLADLALLTYSSPYFGLSLLALSGIIAIGPFMGRHRNALLKVLPLAVVVSLCAALVEGVVVWTMPAG